MLVKVVPGLHSVALTNQKKHARTYYMGTVLLSEARVRFEQDGSVYLLGEVLHEAVEQNPPTSKVRGRMEKYNVSMGEITAKGAYVVGKTIWVAKEVQ